MHSTSAVQSPATNQFSAYLEPAKLIMVVCAAIGWKQSVESERTTSPEKLVGFETAWR